MKKEIVWIALALAVGSLIVNAIALTTISVLQSEMSTLRAEIGGLITIQELTLNRDKVELDALIGLDSRADSLEAFQESQLDLLESLFANDVSTMEILNQLTSTAGTGQ